ncbi:uncharacterized protein FOMMEDRAFT_161532 [Fomitiporia mediterranea MF3/22]|uniref:uncharacterized protein n=1 Tax=Fomitiporia mediterranea (strain MF3/22) TaxID=694068 RepID=UPI0004408B13|nr:uncharacterized protein FOMMEDRAFT_161532 [Fomitiporia mediterranea MF3/22]EJC98704.1 hypothetical protein FOMMEDRAFT_161532 [Fomitiporia mediterranea MF3/22]
MSLVTLPYNSGEQLQLGIDQWEEFQLTSKDPCRTDIVYPSTPQKPVYEIRTDESGSKPVTSYVDATGNVFATLEWHMYLSDKLTVRGGPSQNVSKWLKNRKMSNRQGASFTDGNGESYTWKSAERKSMPTLELFMDNDPSCPIAISIPSTKGRLHIDPGARPASMYFSEQALPARHEIVLSALLIDKQRTFSGKGSVFQSQFATLGLSGVGAISM